MKRTQLSILIFLTIGFLHLASPTFAQQDNPSSTTQTQSVTPAMRSDANDFFQRKDWPNAVKAYEAITKIEPLNANALNRLAGSLHSMGNYERAVEVYKKANDINPQPFTMYNLACSSARLKNAEQAFAWLDKSIKAGYNQPDAMSTDDDLANLRDDVRFKELVAVARVNAKPCAANPLNQQFDFWVGDWRVENTQGQTAGSSIVQLILGDCVVFENWTGNGGSNGKSFNFYNSNLGKWQQTWVDDRGGMLEFIGEYKDGQMRYLGESPAAGVGKTFHRMTFFNLSKDRVRQLWEQSTDGKSWTVAFDGTYVRTK
jgi:tetratricopeptide (TPR) repeat protein